MMKRSNSHVPQHQTIAHLKAEIAFRKQLAIQHVIGKILLPDYYDKPTHDAILFQRMEDTALRMRKLLDSGIALSPFLELGAERGQRSLAMVNDLKATGIAADISWHQLKSADHFAELFKKPCLPLRVCCDILNAPFRDSAFRFVFCFEFLHHFPSPAPVLQQAWRMLGKGTFYFAEEPFKRPRCIIYRRRNKIYSENARQRNKVIRYLERFFSESYSDEREFGVVENDRISLKTWIHALRIFKKNQIMLSSIDGRIQSRLGHRLSFRNTLNRMLGGGIEGTCFTFDPVAPISDNGTPELHQPLGFENDTDTLRSTPDLTATLCCPDCLLDAPESTYSSMPGLVRGDHDFTCIGCNTAFPVIEGVLMLLPTKLRNELYPEFF